MQYIFIIILSLFFIFFNIKIIKSDILKKIIPNKYLIKILFLIPIYYIYLFLYWWDINYLNFFIQIFITILITFYIFYFWIWWAWDAKYLLILALFIPYIWIIPFILNISLITIVYLLLYFLWFYLWKCLINKNYLKWLYNYIFTDLKDSWEIYKINNNWKNLELIIKWFLIFLIIFVSIRILRIYFIKEIYEIEYIKYFLYGIESYKVYLLTLLWILFLLILWIIKYLINQLKKIIKSYFKFKEKIFSLFLMILLTILISVFIYYEYTINPVEIKIHMYKIFTLYICIWLIFKVLIYLYKITFMEWESKIIKISELKTWDIVNKEFLIKMFWEQKCLWYQDDEDTIPNKDLILYPNPKKYISKLNNPIWEEELDMIKNIYNTVNDYHKENNDNFEKIENIKTYNSFSYWPYILIWFIITILFEDKILNLMINFIIEKIKNEF